MSGRNEKLIRKAADVAATQTAQAAGSALTKVIEYARQIEVKAEGLEAAVGNLEIKARHWDSFRLRNFRERLGWLLTGK